MSDSEEAEQHSHVEIDAGVHSRDFTAGLSNVYLKLVTTLMKLTSCAAGNISILHHN